jgi:hypothetical protein
LRSRNSILGRPGALVLTVLLLGIPASLIAKTMTKTQPRHSSTPSSKSSSPTPVSSKKSGGTHGKRSRHSRNWRHRGQQQVDVHRTQQIQQALIRSRYLDGEPSGAWDSRTQEALRRYQEANGWQTKVVPDSRALIKLGLGPSNDRLLNPETAMTTRPEATATVSTPAASETNPPRQ